MKRLLIFVVFICALGAALLGWLWRDMHSYMQNPIALDNNITSFIVSKGTSFNRIVENLEEANVINQPLYFKIYTRINKLGVKIKAGEYFIKKDITPTQLLLMMVKGDTVLHNFTIIEGTTFKQLRASLEAQDDLLKQTLEDKTDAEILAALGATETHPEGLFLAETFQIERNSTDLALLERSYKALQQALNTAWQLRDVSPSSQLSYQTPYEALIMASIVEKETAVAKERPLISGVFIKRLSIGMRLQTDPTVIYGMGDQYQGNITRKDLRTPTPYNTYTINGLPPTPIAMVGREAIHAALNPEVGNALYFVAKGDGYHQFSPSLVKHNQAVRKYQLKRKQAYRSTPEQ